jgi:hypothetical protein
MVESTFRLDPLLRSTRRITSESQDVAAPRVVRFLLKRCSHQRLLGDGGGGTDLEGCINHSHWHVGARQMHARLESKLRVCSLDERRRRFARSSSRSPPTVNPSRSATCSTPSLPPRRSPTAPDSRDIREERSEQLHAADTVVQVRPSIVRLGREELEGAPHTSCLLLFEDLGGDFDHCSAAVSGSLVGREGRGRDDILL